MDMLTLPLYPKTTSGHFSVTEAFFLCEPSDRTSKCNAGERGERVKKPDSEIRMAGAQTARKGADECAKRKVMVKTSSIMSFPW